MCIWIDVHQKERMDNEGKMKKIKVNMLTNESFVKFGKVLEIEGREALGNPNTHLWFPQVCVIEKDTSVNLMKIVPHDFIIKEFEYHKNTVENLIPLDGDLIVALAPAGKLQVDEIEAFYIPCGKGICLNEGVWHAIPFSIGKEVMSTVVFKNNTSNEDIYIEEINETLGLSL